MWLPPFDLIEYGPWPSWEPSAVSPLSCPLPKKSGYFPLRKLEPSLFPCYFHTRISQSDRQSLSKLHFLVGKKGVVRNRIRFSGLWWKKLKQALHNVFFIIRQNQMEIKWSQNNIQQHLFGPIRFFPLAKIDTFCSDFSPANYFILISLLHKATHLTSNEVKREKKESECSF